MQMVQIILVQRRHIANKYMKKHSVSLIVNEIQVKTTMRYYLALFRMVVTKTNMTTTVKDVDMGTHIQDWGE